MTRPSTLVRALATPRRLAVFFLITLIAALPTFFDASSANAQGVLVDIRIDHPVPLPRPIWPNPPRPIPRPRPVPPSSYRIESLDVNATIEDQVARVQVAQTFENTGSVAMEVAFVFPLPYD